MTNNEFRRVQNIIDFIRGIEHELADWKYYQAINGKSIMAVLFFFFLKFISDAEKDRKFDDKVGRTSNVLQYIRENLRNRQAVLNENVYLFLLDAVEQWDDNGDILLQYARRINFEELPFDFISILDKIECLDLRRGVERDDFVLAVVVLYTSLYGEIGLKSKPFSGEVYIMEAAGALLDCKDGMSIYDFSCGTGGLLAYGAANNCVIYAQEKDFEKSVVTYIILKMQQIREIHIKVGDMLELPFTAGEKDLLFDRIISAPPVRKKYGLNKKQQYSQHEEFQYDSLLQENEFWIYARHMIKKMKSDGKAILITPISVLSKEGTTREEREELLRGGYIRGIVQLPGEMCPDANKLCLVLLVKKCKDEKIYMVDFSGEKGEEIIFRQENQICIDINKMSQIVNGEEEIENISKFVGLNTLSENNYNLTPAIYFRNLNEMMGSSRNTDDIREQHERLIKQYYESDKRLEQAVQAYYKLWKKIQ